MLQHPLPVLCRGFMKKCTKCNVEKELSLFPKKKTAKSGYHPHCKACRSEYDKSRYSAKDRQQKYQANLDQERLARRSYYQSNKDSYLSRKSVRRALELQAIPKWAELDRIKTLYSKASQYGMEVDHVVPLKSDLVCGLHCWANLQLLNSTVNRAKGNRYWPDMP